jgi:hypothetical protein
MKTGHKHTRRPAVATPSSQRGLTNLWLIRAICYDVERLSSEDLSLREQVQFERRIRFWAKSICREGRPQRRQTRDALVTAGPAILGLAKGNTAVIKSS